MRGPEPDSFASIAPARHEKLGIWDLSAVMYSYMLVQNGALLPATTVLGKTAYRLMD